MLKLCPVKSERSRSKTWLKVAVNLVISGFPPSARAKLPQYPCLCPWAVGMLTCHSCTPANSRNYSIVNYHATKQQCTEKEWCTMYFGDLPEHTNDLRFHQEDQMTFRKSTCLNFSITLIQPLKYHFSFVLHNKSDSCKFQPLKWYTQILSIRSF